MIGLNLVFSVGSEDQKPIIDIYSEIVSFLRIGQNRRSEAIQAYNKTMVKPGGVVSNCEVEMDQCGVELLPPVCMSTLMMWLLKWVKMRTKIGKFEGK